MNNYVLVRKGTIVTSGSEAVCLNFATNHFDDDQWAILTMDEYSYYKAHPEEIKRSVLGTIAHNTKTGRARDFMRRPLDYNRRRRI